LTPPLAHGRGVHPYAIDLFVPEGTPVRSATGGENRLGSDRAGLNLSIKSRKMVECPASFTQQEILAPSGFKKGELIYAAKKDFCRCSARCA
jgi:hypothetical protein